MRPASSPPHTCTNAPRDVHTTAAPCIITIMNAGMYTSQLLNMLPRLPPHMWTIEPPAILILKHLYLFNSKPPGILMTKCIGTLPSECSCTLTRNRPGMLNSKPLGTLTNKPLGELTSTPLSTLPRAKCIFSLGASRSVSELLDKYRGVAKSKS